MNPRYLKKIARPLLNACFLIPAFLGIAAIQAQPARAIEPYKGSMVADCEAHQGQTYNVVGKIAANAPNWYISMLEYDFTPTPAQRSSVVAQNDKSIYFQVTPGTYSVVVRSKANQGKQGTYSIAAPDCSPPKKGMTWRLLHSNEVTGTIRVGCGKECDAYQGDTPCDQARPLLCILKKGKGFPKPASVDASSRYNRWSGGVVGTTKAVVPPGTLAKADALCAAEFGDGWRVAEFHDGWGWAFQAYGGIGDPAQRFWVHNYDKPQAMCWKP